MGKSQRTKGATYEREIAHAFGTFFGRVFRRNITQARDGGHDLRIGPFTIECKRRKSLATLYGWMRQARVAAVVHANMPVVITRADNEESLVVMRLDDFLHVVNDTGTVRAMVISDGVDAIVAQGSEAGA